MANQDAEAKRLHTPQPLSPGPNTTDPHTVGDKVAATTTPASTSASLDSVAPPNARSLEPTISQRLVGFQDTALRFLANANNETLGACAIGFCASTYLVLGRVGLVLIGAVGGIVLHTTWENSHHSSQDDKDHAESNRRRKEQGLEVAKRVLDWRDRQERPDQDERQDKIEVSTLAKELDYSDFQPETKAALTAFTDAVIRDYVKWWYSPLLPLENVFPTSCRQILTGFILSFANHISRRRTEDPFLDFIANATSIIIVFLNELGTALKASPNQPVDAAIKTYLEYEPDSSLANVLNVQQQERKLRLVADDILQNFLDSKTYNCGPAQVFLREVLTSLILQSTITSCAKPEWINGWIVYMLEDGEPEIMNVIDAGVEDLGDKIATASGRQPDNLEGRKHQRRVSRAEEAMQEAMREAQRMNEMIAEEEARRRRGESIPETDSTTSVNTSDVNIPTPTSSESDVITKTPDPSEDLIFDAEGNSMPSGMSSPANLATPIRPTSKTFTSFDQLTPASVPTALQPTLSPPAPVEAMSAVPLTLHNANITLLDMGTGNDKMPLRQIPNDDFLVQIEPASSRYPGWMVTRRYTDFEPLHETLRRIANISGAHDFNVQNPSVPAWRGQSRATLIDHLEIYLKQTLKFERLAESEAMKKFLNKDIGIDKAPGGNKNVLLQGAAALDNVGKGFINVLGQGGKNIAGGGKAVFGGVQGVFGAVGSAVGPKKSSSPARLNTGDLTQTMPGSTSTLNSGRPSLDFVSGTESQEDIPPPLPSRASIISAEQVESPSGVVPEEILNLPPPPSEISDEFEPVGRTSNHSHRPTSSVTSKPSRPPTPSQPLNLSSARLSSVPPIQRSPSSSVVPSTVTATTTTTATANATVPVSTTKTRKPLTEEETRITVDLMFAIITSTYSLSSAWAFRLSLLSAAKSFILRPNNPQLESIRVLLQESLINNNTTDEAVASSVKKLRENSLPTEEELARWPKEPSAEEKEKLRVKARKLLVERGMPQALTSVMGQAASGEALGKVFDCLQVEEVARGLVFAVLLQGVRAVMQ